MDKSTLMISTIMIVLLIILALAVVVVLEGDSHSELSKPLLDFCISQLRTVVDDCVAWRDAFIDLYADQPAHCLQTFDSDSSLLLMCMDNIVAGRGGG